MVVGNKEKGVVFEQVNDSILLTQPEKVLFEKLEKDCKDSKSDGSMARADRVRVLPD